MNQLLSIATALIWTLQLSSQNSYDLIISCNNLEEKDFKKNGEELHERIHTTYIIVFKEDSTNYLIADHYMIRINRTVRNPDTIILESNRDVIRTECKATIDISVFEDLVQSMKKQIDDGNTDSSLCGEGQLEDLGFSVWINYKGQRLYIYKLGPFTASKPWCLDNSV